jgi:hypothetical protein
MRKIVRILLLLLLFATIFPFVYPWKDGKPLLSWSQLKMPTLASVKLPEMPDISLLGKEETRAPHQPVKVYRWLGEDGGVQFSNEPPAAGVAYAVVEVNPDANLIQTPAKESTSVATKPAEQETGETTRSFPSPLTVSPGQALQLIEDAHKVQQLSSDRLHQQEALTQ